MQIGKACPIKLCGYMGSLINCLDFGVDILTQSRALMKYEVNYDPQLLQLQGPQFDDYDDVIKWKHFPRYWPFVLGTHRSPANSTYKGQWRGALMFSLTCAWTNGWVNNRGAGDLIRHRAHYDVTLMTSPHSPPHQITIGNGTDKGTLHLSRK